MPDMYRSPSMEVYNANWLAMTVWNQWHRNAFTRTRNNTKRFYAIPLRKYTGAIRQPAVS